MSDATRPPRSIDDPAIRQLAALVLVVCLGLLTYGFTAFNLSLVMDNWKLVHDPFCHARWFVRIGRWGNVVIWALAQHNLFAPAVTLLSALVLSVLGVRALAPIFRVEGFGGTLIFAGLLVLCPMLSEHFAYRSNHLGLGCTIWLTCLAFAGGVRWACAPRRRWVGLAVPVLLLTFAVGTMQVAILFYFVLAAFYLMERVIAQERIRAVGAVLALLGALGLSLSLLVGAALRLALGLSLPVPSHSYALHLVSSFADLGVTVQRTGRLIAEFLLQEQHLWPAEVKWIFLLMLAFVAYHAVRAAGPGRRLAALSLLAAVLVLPWGLCLVRLEENSYRYTALLGVVPICPLVCARAYRLARGRLRTAMGAGIAFMVLTFALMNNAAGLAIHVTNQRDLHTTAALLSRVQTAAGVSPVSACYLMGRLPPDEKAPFSLATEGLMRTSAAQCGVYNCQPRRFSHIVRMFTPPPPGTRYAYLKDERSIREVFEAKPASSHLQTSLTAARPWPAPESVLFDPTSGAAFVLLSADAVEQLRSAVIPEDGAQI